MSQIRSEAGNSGFVFKASVLIVLSSALAGAVVDVFSIYNKAMLLSPGWSSLTGFGKAKSLFDFYVDRHARLGWAAATGAGLAACGIGALLYARAIKQNRAYKQKGGRSSGDSMNGPQF